MKMKKKLQKLSKNAENDDRILKKHQKMSQESSLLKKSGSPQSVARSFGEKVTSGGSQSGPKMTENVRKKGVDFRTDFRTSIFIDF